MRWQLGTGPGTRKSPWPTRLKRWLADRLVTDARMRRLLLNALFSRFAAPGTLARIAFPDHAVYVDPRDDRIAYTLLTGQPWQRDLIERAITTLREQDRLAGRTTFLDVGANIGVMTLYALFAPEIEKAVAIEPDPTNLEILARNLSENDVADKVTVLSAAASRQKGVLPLNQDSRNLGAHSLEPGFSMSATRTVPVETDRLDTLLARAGCAVDSVALAKIDVEGHEFAVLEGAPGLIAAATPLMIEVYFDGPADRDRLVSLLTPAYAHCLDLAARPGTPPTPLADFRPRARQHELLIY